MQHHDGLTRLDCPGIYIHIPYCRSKCSYCSFNSYPCIDTPDLKYPTTLVTQINKENDWTASQVFHSLFIGGGTPTVYSGDDLAQLIKACKNNYTFVDDPEISIESNPNSVDLTNLQKCRKAGANRLSIGVQSFNNQLLAVLGRTHTAQDAKQAVTLARDAGFNNVNLDLMFGLPSQNIEDWQHSLAEAAKLHPEHLALYELTIEEDTPFFQTYQSGQLSLPDHDLIADMAEYASSFLADNGYERYEISNFAKKGFACSHNINYWQNGSYLGLGPGAVSNFSGLRVSNVSDPEQYISLVSKEVPPFHEGEALSHNASFRESVIMGMRMLRGVKISHLQNRYGMDPLSYYGKVLQKLIAQNLVSINNGHMALTVKALPLANQVLSQLV